MKARVIGIVLAVAVGVAGGLLTRSGFSIIDADCDDTVRYGVALTLGDSDLGEYDIALIDRDGDVTRLSRDHSSFEPSFSPDGRRLAFVRGSGYWDDTGGVFEDQDIVIGDVDGTNVQGLTEGEHLDTQPAWSPDGDVIAFARYPAGLFVVSVTGGAPRAVVPPGGLELHEHLAGRRDRIGFAPLSSEYSWSPDGDRITFSWAEALYVINEDGSGLRRLAAHLGDINGVAWSPDGAMFAFESDGIATLTFEERNPRLWKKEARSPEFSPDGSHLLFIDDRGPEGTPAMIAPLEGGAARPLAQHPVSPAWMSRLDWLDCHT